MGLDSDGLPFFTMELKQGIQLREVLNQIKQGKMSITPNRRLDIFLRICEALQHAHSNSIAHLDIKPENIQFGPMGEVTLCDWGLSEIIHDENEKDLQVEADLYGPISNLKGGTPGYLAPEFHLNTPHDFKLDIYALGCLMMEWLCLKSPEDKAEDLHSMNPSLKAIIAKAKHEDAEKRYSNMDEMIFDIQRYNSGYSTLVEPKNILREIKLLYQRNTTIFNLCFGFLLIIIIGTFIAFWNINQNKQRAELALKQYLDSQAESKRRLSLQAVYALTNTSSLTNFDWGLSREVYPQIIKTSLKQVDHVISYSPPKSHEIWEQKFWLHFLMQDFKSANELSLENPQRIEDLISLSKEYAKFSSSKPFLSTDKLIQLFTDLSNLGETRNPLIKKNLHVRFRSTFKVNE